MHGKCTNRSGKRDEVGDDFLLRDGRLYSWLPPQETALASSVTGTADAIDAGPRGGDRCGRLPSAQPWLM